MSGAPVFIAEPSSWSDSEVVLDEDESHHATRVMRIRPPDVITVIDGKGRVARCAAARVEGDRLIAEILEVEERRRARPQIAVYQGAAKGSKIDDVVERLAELGVAELTVFASERSIVKWEGERAARVTDRWRSLARSAAKVSRNPYVMEVGGPVSWTELVRRLSKEPLGVVLWEAASLPLRVALSGLSDRIGLVVGPEGGLTRSEAESLADAGGQLVSLGPLILRTENAAVVATSALLFHHGLIG